MYRIFLIRFFSYNYSILHGETFYINTCFIFHNTCKKYQVFRDNRDAMVIILIALEIFCTQNIKDLKNDMKF